jgi:hypothetical protein
MTTRLTPPLCEKAKSWQCTRGIGHVHTMNSLFMKRHQLSPPVGDGKRMRPKTHRRCGHVHNVGSLLNSDAYAQADVQQGRQLVCGCVPNRYLRLSWAIEWTWGRA